MEQEKKYEKKVEVKERPLGGTKRVEEIEMQAEQPSTASQQSRGESMARKSGEAVGSGLKKVSSVLGEFAAGVSKEIRPRKSPREEEAQRTEYRSEQGEQAEASQTEVTEKEKIERKVTTERK